MENDGNHENDGIDHNTVSIAYPGTKNGFNLCPLRMEETDRGPTVRNRFVFNSTARFLTVAGLCKSKVGKR